MYISISMPYVVVCVCVHACVRVCVYTCVDVCCTWMCMHVIVCVSLYMCMCVYVCACVYMCGHLHVHTYACYHILYVLGICISIWQLQYINSIRISLVSPGPKKQGLGKLNIYFRCYRNFYSTSEIMPHQIDDVIQTAQSLLCTW